MHDIVLVLELATRNARRESLVELLAVLGQEREEEESMERDLAPDELLQGLDVVRLARVIVRDHSADLNVERTSGSAWRVARRRGYTYDEVRLLCCELERGFEGLATDVVPVAAQRRWISGRQGNAKHQTYIWTGPSFWSTSRVLVVL